MPCSGPRRRRGSCARRRADRRSSSASGLISRTLRSSGPLPVDRLDPRQVLLDERSRRVLARLHPPLQVGDGRLFEIERARRAGGCARQRRDRKRHERPPGRSRELFRVIHDSVLRFSTRDRRGPDEPADHERAAEELNDGRDLMIAVQRVGQLRMCSQSCPSTSAPVLPADQRQLQRSRIVDVQRDVEQVLAGPPAHHGGGEGVRAWSGRRPAQIDRHEHLRQAAAKRRQEIAERREDYMAGFVKREADQVEE